MIDTTKELPITLSLAARETPNRKGGRGVNTATVWRWTQSGVRGVRLESVMVGGTRMTTRESLSRFFAASTTAAEGKPAPVTPASRQAAIAAAEASLSAAGF